VSAVFMNNSGRPG